MERNCELHTFELAEGECRMCHGSFCVDCLLKPFGDDKPGLCKECAITAGGLRHDAARPVRTREEPRRKGGLLGRLRGAVTHHDHEPELTHEEKVEAEAQEIARMMAEQRVPTTPEPEPEPVPLPENIAPPASVDEDDRPARREHPESVSGGLDLPNKEAETPAGQDDTPILGEYHADEQADPVTPPTPAAAPSPPPPAPQPAPSAATAVPMTPADAGLSRAPELFHAPPTPERGPVEAPDPWGDEPAAEPAGVTADTRPGSGGGDEATEELLRRIAALRKG